MSECTDSAKELKCAANFRNVLEDNHVPAKGRYHNSLVEDSAGSKFYLYDACGVFVQLASGGTSTVDSVNGKEGIVVLTPDDLNDTSTTHKFTTQADINKLAGIETGAQVNSVTSVNTFTGDVFLVTDDIDDSLSARKYVTQADLDVLANTSGVNTGDQDLSGLVPNTRTINTKPLSANIVLNQDEVLDGTTYKQYSQTEKTKLAGIATGATLNDTDANLKNRANHTGTQLASTISDFNTAGWVAVPPTAGSPGVAGQKAYESGFLYICVATNTWERVVMATF